MSARSPARHGRVDRDAISFQPDAVAIELDPLPRSARIVLPTIVLALAAAITWAALAEVDRIVTATGKLVTREPLIVLQSLETAVVRQLDVQVGDRVRAGQVVAVLDPTFAGADLSASRAEVAILDAQMARVRAEMSGSRSIEATIEVPEETLAIERQLLLNRSNEYQARIEAFAARERKARSELDETGKLLATLQKRRENVVEVVTMRETLIDRGASSRLNLITAENERLAVDQELTQLGIRRKSLEEEIQTVMAEREAFMTERRRQLTEHLIESTRQRERLINQLTKSERRTSLVSLVSDVDGVVLERARLSVGSVAQSAQALVTIVPSNAVLECEVEIPSKDIAYVRGTDTAAIKLEAFPFQKYGTVGGRITRMAPDAVQKPVNEGGSVTYKARIGLDAQRLVSAAEVALAPGMVVTAEIKVGHRTVLSYFLYPLIRALDEGIREP
ncbi:MAG: HlyD family type I secretion periplasmic adaptor subunit [Hyphomicrobiales bacterium]|nr:HlyD family type I secretion periplasmic adaptor subunit [Hyphomicrobiales bacterium]